MVMFSHNYASSLDQHVKIVLMQIGRKMDWSHNRYIRRSTLAIIFADHFSLILSKCYSHIWVFFFYLVIRVLCCSLSLVCHNLIFSASCNVCISSRLIYQLRSITDSNNDEMSINDKIWSYMGIPITLIL